MAAGGGGSGGSSSREGIKTVAARDFIAGCLYRAWIEQHSSFKDCKSAARKHGKLPAKVSISIRSLSREATTLIHPHYHIDQLTSMSTIYTSSPPSTLTFCPAGTTIGVGFPPQVQSRRRRCPYVLSLTFPSG
ncbi:hypothetical protein KSS87_012133 [Heliosperma pusillum]|nr:hypothetical protein KSS87_012133 [Heliosperma pusillum]